jgi:Flp pilus assembly protein TadG
MSAPRALLRLLPSRKGASAIEFALLAPVLLSLLFGVAQLGTLFFAHTGLRNAVSEGARFATLFPRPTEAQIVERVKANRVGMEEGRFTEPVVTFGMANGANFAEVQMSYAFPVNFIFFQTPPITLSYSRRAFIPPTPQPVAAR